MTNVEGKRVAVIGLGARTGVSLIRYLHRRKAKIYAYDRKPASDLQANLNELKGINFEIETGTAEPKKLSNPDLMLLSPGVPTSLPFIQRTIGTGIPVWSEIEFAGREVRAPILAITGTNGKSTTTSLLAHILETWGKKVFAGGNLGNPLIEAAAAEYDWLAAEVSSFQLEAVDTFHPKVGILLNLTPNHLDRHGSMEVYAEMKKRLFTKMGAGDRAILRIEDPWCEKIGSSLKVPIWFFSGRENPKADAYVRNDRMVLPTGASVSLHGFTLPGQHNRENAVAACAAALSIGCPTDVMERALRSFKGLQHRLEEVGEIGGVRYINDSKSTTPDAAIRALEAFNRPVFWLAGGRSKGAPYDLLGKAAVGRVQKAILFGEAAKLLDASLGNVPRVIAPNLRSALEMVSKEAKSGDVVLLSPANASFDEFTDYEERGRVFAALVQELKGKGA